MSYAKAVQTVQDRYQSLSAADNITAVPSLRSSLNVLILISWLLISCRLPAVASQWSRLLAFACVVYTSLWSSLYCRSMGVVGSIGVGLNSGLCTIFATNFMLLHDPRTFRRLTRQPPCPNSQRAQHQYNRTDPVVHTPREDKPHIFWEPMPKPLGRRLWWILDLLTSLRGVHWSNSLSRQHPSAAVVEPLSSNRMSSLSRNLLHFIVSYLLLDLIKCLMIADPYFLGVLSKTPSPHPLPHATTPTATYTYRMALSAAGASIAIDMLYALAVLVQVNVLGSSVIGLNAAPAMFQSLWGSPHAIFTKGLRGFWGETWHQMFRMHFTSIGDAVARYMVSKQVFKSNTDGQLANVNACPHSVPAAHTAIRVTTAFLLSGALHASASYTLLGPTRPWAPFLFFALQPLGLAIEHLFSYRIGSRYLTGSYGTLLCQCVNFCFAVAWLCTCAGLLFDDFASGGVWLFEPAPLSLLRGFGFSKEDRRFWCWNIPSQHQGMR